MFCTLGNQKKKKKKEREREKKQTHTRAVSTLLDPALLLWGALSDTPSSGQRAGFGCSTLCAGPHSLSRVPLLSVSTCMCACGRCGWPCQEAPPASPLDVWPLSHVQVGTMSTKKVNFCSGQETPLTCPFSVVAPVHSYLLNV